MYAKFYRLFTARKRSLRRLCFYTCLSFILFTGWESTWAGAPPSDQVHSPRTRYTPRPPQTRYTPPRTRCPLPPGPGTPLGPGTPSGTRYTPPAEHAGRYGQRAGGTHPTGMQSCSVMNWKTALVTLTTTTTNGD